MLSKASKVSSRIDNGHRPREQSHELCCCIQHVRVLRQVMTKSSQHPKTNILRSGTHVGSIDPHGASQFEKDRFEEEQDATRDQHTDWRVNIRYCRYRWKSKRIRKI